MSVDITVRPETGTWADFYAFNSGPEAPAVMSAAVRFNAEPVSPDVAAQFADTLQSKAENQKTTVNGVNYTSKEERGMETIISWVAPEDRTADKKGDTFVGAIYFGDKNADGLNHAVLSYALFETDDGPKVESQFGVYPLGAHTDYLGSLTEHETPGTWFEPHSYDAAVGANPHFAGYDVAHTPVTNDELSMVLGFADPAGSVETGPVVSGFETEFGNPGLSGGAAGEIGTGPGGAAGGGPAGGSAA